MYLSWKPLFVTLLLSSALSARADEAVTAALASTIVVPQSDMIVLTVDKGRLMADLHTWPADPSKAYKLRSFRIAVGKAEGDKQFEGDNKTPEGIYFAQNHINGNTLPAKYGTMAIPIDFPNPMDRGDGKTGHGIWLHGVDNDERIEEAKVTEGCVAFYNPDIAKLGSWLKSHQGVIVIARDSATVNKPSDIETVRAATEAWMKSWAERDLAGYISHYAGDFRYQRYNKTSYGEYKGRVFASYKTMAIGFDSLRVISHPKYAVSFFNQDFNGDGRYRSVGRKILYWEKSEEGQWQIKREIFENRRFEHVTFTEAELASLSAVSVSKTTLSVEKDTSPPSL